LFQRHRGWWVACESEEIEESLLTVALSLIGNFELGLWNNVGTVEILGILKMA
jgi:hypothetical protein